MVEGRDESEVQHCAEELAAVVRTSSAPLPAPTYSN
jgi:hypothetical protein